MNETMINEPNISLTHMLVAGTSGTLIVLISCVCNGIVIQLLAFSSRKKNCEKLIQSSSQPSVKTTRSPLASVNSVTGVFLLNLAIIDILSALFNIPVNILHDVILGKWTFGPYTCFAVVYIQSLITYACAFTQIVISLDRLSAVYWPINRRKIISPRHARGVVFGLWLLSALVNVLIMSVATPILEDGMRCRQNFSFLANLLNTDQYGIERQYTMVDLHLHYILPLLFITSTYLAIVKRLWGSAPPGTLNIWREAYLKKSKRKLVKMVIIVAVLFAIMRLPRHIYFLFIHQSYLSINLYLFVFTFDWLAYTVNPIIYAWMNASFRMSFLASLTNCCACIPRSKGDTIIMTRRKPKNFEMTENHSTETVC